MRAFAALVFTGTFTIYTVPRSAPPRIEAMTDRGPIVEMIVGCQNGTAIITYSKLEKLYCGPKRGCDRSQTRVIRDACG